MTHEQQLELAIEILQLSRDGDTLSMEELQLVQDSVNFLQTEEKQERLKFLAEEWRAMNK